MYSQTKNEIFFNNVVLKNRKRLPLASEFYLDHWIGRYLIKGQ